MKVDIIAECSLSILQYFWPALSENRSWKQIFGLLFEWLLKTGFITLYIIKLSALNEYTYKSDLLQSPLIAFTFILIISFHSPKSVKTI